MDLTAEIFADLHLRVSIEARRERYVELAARIDDAPRFHRTIPIVGPVEFDSQLGEATVDDQAVLGEARSCRPLRAELQTNDVFARPTSRTPHANGPSGPPMACR
jgi:hypothetical protein